MLWQETMRTGWRLWLWDSENTGRPSRKHGGRRTKSGPTCFLFDFAQDVEKSRLHSVTVQSVFPEKDKRPREPSRAGKRRRRHQLKLLDNDVARCTVLTHGPGFQTFPGSNIQISELIYSHFEHLSTNSLLYLYDSLLTWDEWQEMTQQRFVFVTLCFHLE